MTVAETLGILATLSVFCNRIVEAVKPAVASLHLTEDAEAWVLRVLSLVIGCLFTLAMQLNVLSMLSTVPPLAGMLVTGVLLGSGAGVLHQITDLWTDFSDAFPDVVAPKASASVDVKASVETTAPPPGANAS